VPVLHAISGPRPRHPHHPVRPHADPLTHGLPYSLAQVGPCADHLPAPSTSTVPPRRPHCCVLHNYWRRRARAHAHEHDPLSTSTLVPSSTRLYTLISVLEEVVVCSIGQLVLGKPWPTRRSTPPVGADALWKACPHLG
jgi:hypothetical protein